MSVIFKDLKSQHTQNELCILYTKTTKWNSEKGLPQNKSISIITDHYVLNIYSIHLFSK